MTNMGIKSTIGVFCILSELKDMPGKPIKKIKMGRTEVVKNFKNPKFLTKIDASFQFEERQNFMVEIYEA
jgi:hypothetical protein